MAIRFDTHMHTEHSPCSILTIETLVRTAYEKGLQEIVITDHNTSEGALDAKLFSQAADIDIKVHLGIELNTEFGELNVSFLSYKECQKFEGINKKKEKFEFKKIYETIKKIKDNKTEMLICLNHPYSLSKWSKRRGFNFKGIIETGMFKNMEDLMEFFDYTEINTSNICKEDTDKAIGLAERFKIPLVCATDTHFKEQIGEHYSIGFEKSTRESIITNNIDNSCVHKKINYSKNKKYRTISGILKKGAKLFMPYFSYQ